MPEKYRLDDLLGSLREVQDAKGQRWFEGWIPADACRPCGFRPIDRDRVRKLLTSMAEEGQQISALGHLTDTEIVIDQGVHRREAALILRTPLLVRLLCKADATPERIRAMQATVEESNQKLDDISTLTTLDATMREEGLSAAEAARKHHARPEVYSRIGYILNLDESDPFRQLAMGRKLTTEQVALLKKVAHADRLGYAERLIAGKLTTKQLREELAAANGKPTNGSTTKPSTYRRKINGVEITATYRDRAALLLALRKAIEELEGQQ
jgi:hypothetical protein